MTFPSLCRRDQYVLTSTTDRGTSMYLMAFFSKHQLGYTFWDRITTQDEKGQIALDW